MKIALQVLACLVAVEFFYIMYLETFATHSDMTSRVFNMSKEEAIDLTIPDSLYVHYLKIVDDLNTLQ